MAAVRLAAALLIPWRVTGFDTVNDYIPFFLRQRAGRAGRLYSREIVPPGLHGVNLAGGAEIIRIRAFVSHDAAGNGSDQIFFGQVFKALLTFHHDRSSLLFSGITGQTLLSGLI